MNKVSPHFSRSEFSCKCGCGFSSVDTELLQLLEILRSKFGEAITINSGNRCEEYNDSVGGSYGSKHKKGIAADIAVKNTEPKDVYKFIDNYMPIKGGIGLYDSFVHVDVREKKARWKG